jgi:DNA-binding transcriptional regulator YiaG
MGKHILEIKRVKAGLKRSEVARRIGCSYSSVVKWEKRERIPVPKWANKLRDLFNELAEELKDEELRLDPWTAFYEN